MHKKTAFFVFIAATLLGCTRSEGSFEIPETLSAVPSDAIIVIQVKHLEDGLNMAMDSTHAMRCLPWGRLAGYEGAVSFVYNGTLSPVVCVEAGHSSKDTLSVVKGLLREASQKKLFAHLYPAEENGRKKGILIMCQSEAVFTAAIRHIDAGTSILDAPDFKEAYATCGGHDAVIIRNSGWDKILPKKYLDGLIPRKEMLRFAKNASEWTLVLPGGDGADILTFQHEDGSQFANVLPNLQDGESRLASVLPSDSDFALALPLGTGFRDTYRNWRYACSNLDKYEKELVRLEKESGLSPLAWEKRSGVREVCMVSWGGGHKVILFRADCAEDCPLTTPNPMKGFAKALYGSIFSGVDDSVMMCSGGWCISGTKNDVEAYANTEKVVEIDAIWPEKPCKFVIWKPGEIFFSDRKGTVIKTVK